MTPESVVVRVGTKSECRLTPESVRVVTESECLLCLSFGGKVGGLGLGLYPGNLSNSSVIGNGNSSGLKKIKSYKYIHIIEFIYINIVNIIKSELSLL